MLKNFERLPQTPPIDNRKKEQVDQAEKSVGHYTDARLKKALRKAASMVLGGVIGIGAGEQIRSHYYDTTEQASKLHETFGYAYTGYALIHDRPLDQEKKEQHFEALPCLEGTLTDQKLKTIAKTTLPQNWFQESVSSISVNTGAGDVEAGNPLVSSGGVAIAMARPEPDRRKTRIDFQPAIRRQPMQYVVNQYLTHEFCHAVEQTLDRGEFDDLMMRIKDRINAPDRYKSAYVESIHSTLLGSIVVPKAASFTRGVEYWAEICGEYMSFPENLHVKDFTIVRDVIAKRDPKFNPKTAGAKRRKAVLSLVSKYYDQQDAQHKRS